jgi:hypothetical protein
MSRIRKQTGSLTMRWVVYFAGLALTLWLRFRASVSDQATVAYAAAFLGLVAVNFWCVRLFVGYATSSTEQPVRLVARSASAIFLIIGVLGIGLCDIVTVSMLFAAIRALPVDHDVLGYGVMSGFVGSLLAYGGAYEVRIIDDRVDYFTLVTGKRSLARQDIEHARVKLWSHDPYRPTNRLELIPGTASGLRPIIVNLRAFKKPDLSPNVQMRPLRNV